MSIMPYLTYCHLVKKNANPLIAERSSAFKSVRCVHYRYKSQTETYEELLTRAKVPTLYNRRLQDIAILMNKVKYGMAPRCVSELFTIKSTHQRLRNWVLNYPALIQWPMRGIRCAIIWSEVTSVQELDKPQSIQERFTRCDHSS